MAQPLPDTNDGLAANAPRGRLLLGLAVVRLSRLHGNREIALQAFPGVVDRDGRIRFAPQHRDFAARADF